MISNKSFLEDEYDELMQDYYQTASYYMLHQKTSAAMEKLKKVLSPEQLVLVRNAFDCHTNEMSEIAINSFLVGKTLSNS